MKIENTVADIDFDMEKYTCNIEVTFYIHYIKNILCFFVSNIDIHFFRMKMNRMRRSPIIVKHIQENGKRFFARLGLDNMDAITVTSKQAQSPA